MYLAHASFFAMLPVAFPVFADDRHQSPRCRKRANRFALALVSLTALVSLVGKYWS
jgi:hypothetical protein